jgi:hypothetical protein
MYALNQALIANPVHVDRDTITGTLHGSGAEFKFRRHLAGWEVRLEISVNGVRLHDGSGPQERECFDVLSTRAYQYGSVTANIARGTAKKIASEFFGG